MSDEFATIVFLIFILLVVLSKKPPTINKPKTHNHSVVDSKLDNQQKYKTNKSNRTNINDLPHKDRANLIKWEAQEKRRVVLNNRAEDAKLKQLQEQLGVSDEELAQEVAKLNEEIRKLKQNNCPKIGTP